LVNEKKLSWPTYMSNAWFLIENNDRRKSFFCFLMFICYQLYLPYNSPCAASLAGILPGGLGLSGLVHEEAHLSISLSLSNLL